MATLDQNTSRGCVICGRRATVSLREGKNITLCQQHADDERLGRPWNTDHVTQTPHTVT